MSLRAPSRAGSVRVFLLAFVVFAYFMPRWADWNIDSRLDLVHAIVDKHSLQIDAYHWNTWDKAVYQGHYYSDKAPGTAVLGAVVYGAFVLARQAPGSGGAIRAIEASDAWNPAIRLGRTPKYVPPETGGSKPGGCQRAGLGNVQTTPWGNRLVPPKRDWALSKYVLTVGVVGLLSALFAAFFFWFLSFFALSAGLRWLLTALYAFATDALPYSTNFYSHQLAAAFLFVAFALLFLRKEQRAGPWAPPLAGFLLGFALFTEYTVALIIPIVGLYGVWVLRRSPREITGFIAFGLVPLFALFAYNAAAFSGPLDTGYSHDFCWSAAQGAGYAGFTYPRLGPLFDLTLGSYRGLFYMSPFLLLALPGLIWMARRRLGVEAAVCGASAILFIVALSAYWGWNGGKVEGPRYLVPTIPFLAFPVIFYLQRAGRSFWAWAVFIACALWSLFVVWAEFLGGALFPISWDRNPLVQDSLPALARNDIAPNLGLFFGLHGWESLVPLVLAVGLIAISGRWRRRASAGADDLSTRIPVHTIDV